MPAVRFYPIVTLVGDRDLASLTNALQLLENVLDGRLDGLNIADGVITTSKLADASVTFAKGSGLAQVVFGRYVGDGTQNRIINPGFDPKYVKVIKQTDSSLYESHYVEDGQYGHREWWRHRLAGTHTRWVQTRERRWRSPEQRERCRV